MICQTGCGSDHQGRRPLIDIEEPGLMKNRAPRYLESNRPFDAPKRRRSARADQAICRMTGSGAKRLPAEISAR